MTEQPVVAVEIAAADGTVLRGQCWGRATSWVILLHDRVPGDDLDCWLPLAPDLAARGWTVLAVDLRGHGASDGDWGQEQAKSDVAALAREARARGAGFVAIVAAGKSAIAALRSAPEAEADALVLLSPAIAPERPISDLRGAGEAKLIVVGGGDPAARAAGERLAKTAIGWVMLVNLPTAAQGAGMLRQPVATHLKEHLVTFLAEQRFVARGRPDRGEPGPAARAGATTGETGLRQESGIK